jgi:hypothetical protein
MTNDQSLIPGLDALANWRQSLARELASLTHFFTSNELLSAPSLDIAESLRQRILPTSWSSRSWPSSRAASPS